MRNKLFLSVGVLAKFVVDNFFYGTNGDDKQQDNPDQETERNDPK